MMPILNMAWTFCILGSEVHSRHKSLTGWYWEVPQVVGFHPMPCPVQYPYAVLRSNFVSAKAGWRFAVLSA